MYPLSVTLVGCQDGVQSAVLGLLIDRQASLGGQYPDIDAALAARDGGGLPQMLVVHVSSSELLPKLRKLVSAAAGQPVVALVDAAAEPGLLLGAMRAGAAQVVPMPILPDDFAAALDCIAGQFGQPAAFNQAVAVSGVTGGCGATALAVNIAYELASQQGQNVILSELSPQIGKLAAYLDINPTLTTFDLLSDGERIEPAAVRKALARVSERFDVLAGEYRQITPVSVAANDVLRLMEVCQSLADYSVFDVPCTYDDLYFETLLAADQVILVGEQKIPSIRTLKLVCEALDRTDGLRKLHIVINRYDPRMPGFAADRLRNLLGKPEILTVANDYASVMASINHGRPLRQESPRSPALADVERLARTLLNQGAEPAAAPVGGRPPAILGRLIRRFGLAN